MKLQSLLPLLCLALTSTITHAQQTFKKSLQGGLPLNHITMVQTGDQGTAIVRGNTDATADFIVTKLDKNGAEKWSKKYNMPGTASVLSITPDTKDNGFALLLKLSSNAGIGVLKCDSLGSVEWKGSIAVKDRVLSWSVTNTALITNTKDGGFFVGAVTNPYGNYSDRNRIILIRLDKNGNKLWHTSHEMKSSSGYTDDFTLDAISETPDKGIVIAERYAACEFYCYNTHFYGFDQNGKSNLSQVIYGSSSIADPFRSLTVTQFGGSNNNMEVIGNVNNWDDPYSQKAYFRLKQDPATTVYLLQDNIFTLSDFLTNKSSSAFFSKSIEQIKTVSLFRNDGSVFQAAATWNQYDAKGRICPDFTTPVTDIAFSKRTDLIQGIALLTQKSDSVIATSLSVAVTSIPASVQTECSGSAPGFAATTAVTDVKTIEVKKQFVYPNPAKNILNIQVSGKANVSLINQSGKTLITTIINNKGEINIAHLPAGLYYLRNNTTGEVQKVIVSK